MSINKSISIQSKKKTLNITLMILSLLVALALESIEIFFAFSNMDMPFWIDWINLVLASIIIGMYGWKFFYWSYEEIVKYKITGMYTMISLCVLVSYCFSFYPLIANTINYANNINSHSIMSFFPTSGVVVAVVNIGNYISEKLEHKAENDIESISKLKVNMVHLFDKDLKVTKDVEINNVKIGQFIQIKKGESIPLDCIVHKGITYVNEANVTGESRPVNKQKGSNLISGTINEGSTIIAKVIKDIENSTINQIIESVKKIQEQKPKVRKIADKISKYFVPTIILIAIITFFIQSFVPGIENISSGWMFGNHKPDNKFICGVYYAVAVLAVSCPCALGIAVPLASLSGISKASKNGIIINHSSAYEKANKIDVVAFDKTGTLTNGKFELSNIIGNKKNLEIIYHIEKHSIHPIAKSFVNYYEHNYKKIKDYKIIVKEKPGIGLIAKYNSSTYEIVSYKYFKQTYKQNKNMNKEIKQYLDKYEKSNDKDLLSLSVLIKNNIPETLLVFKDEIKPNVMETIKVLKDRNIEVVMITGDNEKTAKILASKLGIEYFANTLPSDKLKIIRYLQKQNKKVCYVGDGINDIEALKQSNLSISISKDNAVINDLVDISVLNNDLLSVIKAIFLTKMIKRIIILNLVWAFAYNLLTIPLTVLGYLPAFIAVIAMMSSDGFVIANSIFFKTKKFRYISKKEINKLNLKDDYMI